MTLSDSKPLLPLRDIVIFPSIVTPLFVGRKKSIRALEEVMKSDKSMVLVTQKNPEVDDPQEEHIYSYGCLGKVLQLLKLPDGTVKVLVEGLERVKILKMDEELPDQLAVLFFDVVNTIGPDDIVQTMEDSVMLHYVQDNIHNYEVNLTRSVQPEEGDKIAEALDDAMDYDFELEASTSIETDLVNGIK